VRIGEEIQEMLRAQLTATAVPTGGLRLFSIGERYFFSDRLAQADMMVIGHILHDWDLAQKRLLLKRAHDSLPEGGTLIVYDAIIDDERRENAFGLLMSLNMPIETKGGFDYTGAELPGLDGRSRLRANPGRASR
jgi:hypothetical protein